MVNLKASFSYLYVFDLSLTRGGCPCRHRLLLLQQRCLGRNSTSDPWRISVVIVMQCVIANVMQLVGRVMRKPKCGAVEYVCGMQFWDFAVSGRCGLSGK